MTGNAYFFDEGSPASPNFDLFANDLCLLPPALVCILVGILRVKFLDVEVLNVGDSIGDAPRNMLVVSDNHSWRAWKTGANDVYIPCYQVALVPDRWSGLAQVRVVTEDGKTRSGHSAIDNPVVAGAHHAKAAELFELFVLL